MDDRVNDVVADRMADVIERIDADGYAVVAGIPAHALLDAAAALGTPVPQSPRGELVEDVRDHSDTEAPDGRGYRAGGELPPHSDPPTLLALHCVRAARSGGESKLVGVQAIHDRIAASDPSLLEELYRPFPQWRVAGMYGRPDPGPDHVERPVFAATPGREERVSCVYYRPYIELAAATVGRPLSPAQVAALDLFDECATAPEATTCLHLRPGQTLFLHNRRVLHARTDYEDWPDLVARRHLRRVWIDAPTRFPTDPRHEFGDLFAPPAPIG